MSPDISRSDNQQAQIIGWVPSTAVKLTDTLNSLSVVGTACHCEHHGGVCKMHDDQAIDCEHR